MIFLLLLGLLVGGFGEVPKTTDNANIVQTGTDTGM
jgi:hypothetical protein